MEISLSLRPVGSEYLPADMQEPEPSPGAKGTNRAMRTLVAHTLVVGMPVTGALGTGCGGANGAPGATPTATSHGPPAQGNPFDGAALYVNPDYAAEIATGMGADAPKFAKVGTNATGVWLDTIAKSHQVPHYLDDAAAKQKAAGRPMVATFVIYDLPNRDCSAASSAGELAVESNGEARYRTEYIDGIAAAFQAHPSVRIVAIIEPDSLGNLVSNLDKPKCKASAAAYKHSITYAVQALSMPNVWIYLDAAHAGWLGWNGNRDKAAALFAEVMTASGGMDKVRGFATNVSNYSPVHELPGKPRYPGDPSKDELTYIQRLTEVLGRVGVTDKTFIIDTGRNGAWTSGDSWCNAQGAGLGERPQPSPLPLVDAYYWIKPPGESDGTSDPAAPRYDAACGSKVSKAGAPQAGTFFPAAFTELVANANPPL
jgi:cellulose 1,4-beta-cellobiosidase